MTHYICDGSCQGASETPSVCCAEDCERKGETLRDCDCDDGNHRRA